jgi:hypothetical protein
VCVPFGDIQNSVHEKNHEIPRHTEFREIPPNNFRHFARNTKVQKHTEFRVDGIPCMDTQHPMHVLCQNRGRGHSDIYEYLSIIIQPFLHFTHNPCVCVHIQNFIAIIYLIICSFANHFVITPRFLFDFLKHRDSRYLFRKLHSR